MATSQVLTHLYSLDTSSPEFSRHLYRLIQNDEEEEYLSTLQGPELLKLVDFLDTAVGITLITDDISRRCLHKLQVICSKHTILPTSYTISGDLTRVGSDPIGTGGFADVWEGTYDGIKVCIKCPRVTKQTRQSVEKAFYKEAIMWKKLRHPNVVPFVGVTKNPLQFISEWMPNGILTEYVSENPGANRIGLLLDVAEGLAYLHAKHTVHGDLKGPNILIDHGGHARLTDFGFASVARGLHSVLVTSVQGYTARWAAPEVLETGDKNTRAADVFAFAMVVIEVFTGQYPFSELSAPVTISKIMDGERPDRPQEPGVPDAAWDMTVRCWHQDPTQRPKMKRVVTTLRECYRVSSMDPHASTSVLPRPEESVENTSSSDPTPSTAEDEKPTSKPTFFNAEEEKPTSEPTFLTAVDEQSTSIQSSDTDDTGYHSPTPPEPAYEEPSPASSSRTPARSHQQSFEEDRPPSRQKQAVDNDIVGLEMTRVGSHGSPRQQSRKPRLFVWGEKENGRLGLSNFPRTTLSDVSFPVELHIPGVQLVRLAASGRAFHALDTDGSVHVWGTLNGDSFPSGDGFSDAHRMASRPLKLQMPAPTLSISCGRFHAMTLDTNSTVWTFRSWGRPFRLISPLLNCLTPETTPLQIECGWVFCSVLTRSGDVYAWWPFDWAFENPYWQIMGELDRDRSTRAIVSGDGTVIPCHAWEMKKDPVKLPVLPYLPDLPSTGIPKKERKKNTKLIKIAAFDNSMIGLTNKGHVLKIDGLTGGDSIRSWRYLPNYSEIEKVKEHSVFRSATSGGGQQQQQPQVQLSSDTMHITHISAHFRRFFAYSSSMVLEGEVNTSPEALPTIIPELQNKSVISVVLGDYFFGALTSSGRLMTWGGYCKGALGLGDPGNLPVGSPGGFANREDQLQAQRYGYGTPPDVAVPSEVRFDHELTDGKKTRQYCLTVTASGWHAGAIVIDLDEDEVTPTHPEQHLERPGVRRTWFARRWSQFRKRG